MLINLMDARRGLHEKCVELFTDKNIAEQIYRKLCEGIDDCEECLSARPKGKWIDKDGGLATCSACGERWGVWSVMNYCPSCGADMREAE